MRVFFDTNVLVSAFATRGLCADLMEIVLLEHDLIVGRNVVRELSKALRQKVRLPSARVAEVVDFVTGEASLLVDVAQAAAIDAEPEDALVIGEALAGNAEVFVTGDSALLRLPAIPNLKIASPRQFWEILHTQA